MMKRNIFHYLAIAGSIFKTYSQDLFPVTQLTSDSEKKGFPAWSPDSDLVVYSVIADNDTLRKTELWQISIEGKSLKHIYLGLAEHPKWSPDGRFIVFDADSGKSIQMIPAQGGTLVKILPDFVLIRSGGSPCWSPDGLNIAFREGGSMSICVINLNTKAITRVFSGNGLVPVPGCWTKDGKHIFITLLDRQTRKSALWKVSADGREKTLITGHHEGLYRFIDLSPDGSLLVYCAMEKLDERWVSGLWVMSVNGGPSICMVGPQGFNEAQQWSPDGKKLVFSSSRSGSNLWFMEVDPDAEKSRLEK
jgi:Tol biopolymer transport system component